MSTTEDNFSSLAGRRLTEERKRLGFSQEEAGRACGVSREMWGKYERGRAVMGTEVLARFGLAGADALYVLTGQRAGGAPAAPALTREEEALLDNFRHCPPDARRAIKATSDALAKYEGCCVTKKKAG